MRERIKAEFKSDKAHYASLSVLFAAGFAIRLFYLFQPFNRDEGLTYIAFASKSLWSMFTNYTQPNNHILHSAFAHLSTMLFGNSVWAIRLPAFLAGVAVLPLAYFVIRRHYNKWAGLLTVVLITFSYQLVSYSDQARGYSIQAALLLVLILIAMRLKRQASWLWWGWFAVVMAIMMCVMPTSLFLLFPLVLWMVLSVLFRDTWDRRWVFLGKTAVTCLAGSVLTVVLYLPLLVSGKEYLLGGPWMISLPIKHFIKRLPDFLATIWRSWNIEIPTMVVYVLVISALVAIIFHKKVSRDKFGLPVVFLFGSFIAICLQRSVPYVRTTVPLVPLYFGLASAGLWFIGSKCLSFAREKGLKAKMGGLLQSALVVGVSLLLGLVIINAQVFYQTMEGGTIGPGTFMDARKVTSFLEGYLKSGDIVLEGAPTIVEYEFMRKHVPVGYIYTNASDAATVSKPKRVLVLQAYGEREILSDILQQTNGPYPFPYELVTDFRMIKQFEHAQILEADVKQ